MGVWSAREALGAIADNRTIEKPLATPPKRWLLGESERDIQNHIFNPTIPSSDFLKSRSEGYATEAVATRGVGT
jgi:hypothetical protein